MNVSNSSVTDPFGNGADLPLYIHERLPPKSRKFRLFKLRAEDEGFHQHSAESKFGSVLRGRIIVADLNQAPFYEALSYCWGGSIEPTSNESPEKDPVLISMPDGTVSRLMIEAPLSVALRHLRARGQHLPIFVDQICIDQTKSDESREEKGWQISLMGDIYRSSVSVVAWLDVATKNTDSFFDWIPLISDNMALRGISRQRDRASAVLKAALSKRSDFGDDKALSDDMASMKALAQQCWPQFPHQGFLEICLRKWFRRIWIVQEACLGDRVVLICGRRSCTIQELEMVVTFQVFASCLEKMKLSTIWNIFSSSKKDRARHEALMASTSASRLLWQRAQTQGHRLAGHDQSRGLASLVMRFNVDSFMHGEWVRYEATDPHDYIYALKGLATDEDPVLKALEPDYNKSAEDVFIEYTLLTICSKLDTLLLSQNDRPKLATLPSWVPDWSANLALPYGYKLGGQPLFCAGNPSDESPHVEMGSAGNDSIRVKGTLLCRVDKLGVHSMEMPQPLGSGLEKSSRPLPRSVFNFFREVRAFCESAFARSKSASIPLTANLEEAVWVTTTGGHGLSLTTERDLLGHKVNGKPLLGHLWDLQLRMDVWPTIQNIRSDGLGRLSSAWIKTMEPRKDKELPFITSLRATFTYWVGRFIVECLHLFWCLKLLISRPFLGVESEDMLYYSVFGGSCHPAIGHLHSTLARHVGRKCFASEAGHVGLGPKTTRPGDMVVVLQGATTPVILRPVWGDTSRCSYVGEAYCHGYMHGEAITNRSEHTAWFEIN